MDNLQYSKKEIKVFEKTLKAVIKDLNDLWNIGTKDEIIVPAILEGIENTEDNYPKSGWIFVMDKTGFYIKNGNHTYTFAEFQLNGKLKEYLTIRQADIIFLKEYEQIREDIVFRIRKALEEKKDTLEYMKNLVNRLNNETNIEITSTSQNQLPIEVTTENGKNIGILNFKDTSIKIITTGSITLVDQNTKQELPKIKRK